MAEATETDYFEGTPSRDVAAPALNSYQVLYIKYAK